MARTRELQRNDPCPCGSGRKLKRCCAARLQRRKARNARIARVLGLALVVGLGVGALLLARNMDWESGSEARRVWSEEHGHWHTVRDN